MDAKTIRERVSMFDVLDRLGIPAPNGGEGKIPCIFHEDRTPSLHVYEDHYWAYCCDRGGSVIDFVMDYFGCGFGQAVRFLGSGVDEMAPARVQRAERTETNLTDRFFDETDDPGPHREALEEWVRRKWPATNWETLEYWGVRPSADGHSIWIPHYDWTTAAITGIKIRAWSGAKLSVKGSRFPNLYRLPRHTTRRAWVLCEGESDTWCMDTHLNRRPEMSMGVAGLPSGAGSWRTSMVEDLKGALVVFTAFDLDDAGDAATARVRTDLGAAGIPTQQLHPPGGRVAEALADGWVPPLNL